MSDNSFGRLLRVTTFGESHGPAIGCVIDGCPPGIAIAAEGRGVVVLLRDITERHDHMIELQRARKLAEDLARPIIYYRRAATCWQPQLKGFVLHHNSIYNGWRLEDVWLDK